MADATMHTLPIPLPIGPLPGSQEERTQAELLALRYRAEFVDL